MSDETSIQKPEAEAVAESIAIDEEDAANHPAADEKKTPKRTPKRRSFIERAQRESEELVRTMGGSLELEGGRRTRSSTRGTPTRATEAVTPPPSKKARTSPATTKSAGKGRGARKLDVGGGDEVDPETVKSKPAEEEMEEEKEVPTKANESVKVNATAKKGKKAEKQQKPKEAVVKGKEVKKNTEDSTKSKETASNAIESKDQTDSAAEVPAVQEDKKNNVDNDKSSTNEPEVKEKTPEPLAKSEEAPKVESPSKGGATGPASDTAMDVDEEDKEKSRAEQHSADTTSSDTSASAVSTETVKESAESKESQARVEGKELDVKPAEPAKQQTPEPMEVDSSAKASSESAEPISPVKEVAPVAAVVDESEIAPTTGKSNNEIELATEAKEDELAAPEKVASASEVESTSAENNTAKANDAPVSNDVSKLAATVVPVDSAVTEPPAAEAAVKEPQANCENKSEHNDNGEPKIVNNATEDGENHVTPQACN